MEEVSDQSDFLEVIAGHIVELGFHRNACSFGDDCGNTVAAGLLEAHVHHVRHKEATLLCMARHARHKRRREAHSQGALDPEEKAQLCTHRVNLVGREVLRLVLGRRGWWGAEHHQCHWMCCTSCVMRR
jgi:hypothetical protein